jgi:hypothetical protein
MTFYSPIRFLRVVLQPANFVKDTAMRTRERQGFAGRKQLEVSLASASNRIFSDRPSIGVPFMHNPHETVTTCRLHEKPKTQILTRIF